MVNQYLGHNQCQWKNESGPEYRTCIWLLLSPANTTMWEGLSLKKCHQCILWQVFAVWWQSFSSILCITGINERYFFLFLYRVIQNSDSTALVHIKASVQCTFSFTTFTSGLKFMTFTNMSKYICTLKCQISFTVTSRAFGTYFFLLVLFSMWVHRYQHLHHKVKII